MLQLRANRCFWLIFLLPCFSSPFHTFSRSPCPALYFTKSASCWKQKNAKPPALPAKGTEKLGGTTLVNCNPLTVLSFIVIADKRCIFIQRLQGRFHISVRQKSRTIWFPLWAGLHVLILFTAKNLELNVILIYTLSFVKVWNSFLLPDSRHFSIHSFHIYISMI